MPSLKDLRNRIAATKATQKITKAMQMVAASKLRRAQAAAEAARPYATHMDKVLGNIAASVAGLDTAPRLLRGTGSDNVHLLLVCTAERGLCGPFNTAIVRLARERANALMGEGKEVKFFCVGRKGYDQLRRLYAKQIVELVDLRAVRTLQFRECRDDRRKDHRAVRQVRIRHLHAVLLALPFGDRANPDRAADHPAGVRREGGGRAGRRGLRIRAGRGRHSSRAVAAQRRRADLPRASGKRRLVLRRADVGDGQCHPQCRRHDPQADAAATTARARR